MANIKPKAGKNIFPLPIETAIIVPSTGAKQRAISANSFRNRIRDTRKFLSNLFGGYTSVSSTGGFTTKKGRLIEEKGNIVWAYAEKKTYLKNKRKFLAYARKKKKEWKQDAIGIIVENDLFFIS